MYLKSLEVGGFKSFAKKDELEFSTPITGIVGPNGSGKSNIAESFRFVLGEQSIKSMRGKRGEDLIWGGSHSVPRSNRASVKITLNNEARVFPVDFDEVSIERVVHRDGQNEYSINGSRTRLRDVHELLAAANIGPSGHHIISQGEADRILSSPPKERREMIEDALGLKVYQYKKVESEKKLEKARENMAHVESLRKEVQPHLKFLERQVKKIEKTRELREQLSTFYAEYLKREELYLEKTKSSLSDAMREPKETLKQLEEELDEARSVLEKEKEDAKRTELIELEEKMSRLRSKRHDITRQHGRIEGQIEFLQKRVEHTKEERNEENVRIPLRDVEHIVRDFENRKDDPASLFSLVLGALRDVLEKAREGLRVPDTDDASELASLRIEQEKLDGELRQLEEVEHECKEQYEKLRLAIEADADQSREAEREVFRVMEERRVVEATLSELEHQERELVRDREAFDRELREGVALIGSAIREYKSFSVDGITEERREEQEERRRELEKMKIRLEEAGSGSNEEILKEYEEVKGRDEFLEREIRDLETSASKLEELIDDLSKELNERFLGGLEKINVEFNRFFVLMFNGGGAELKRVKPKPKKINELEGLSLEEEEVVEEGIEIDVKLPNKRVRGLEMLSGGERALTSIALIFAMSQVNPPLFVILDETDAALDEANSRRYGDMIESLAKKSQLILITHNRETMSRAGVLYGITMGGDGVSKLLSIKFDEAVAVAK